MSLFTPLSGLAGGSILGKYVVLIVQVVVVVVVVVSCCILVCTRFPLAPVACGGIECDVCDLTDSSMFLVVRSIQQQAHRLLSF
jgi:hypothetical protein